MDKLEAKMILHALRPDDLKTDQPAVAEALALAKSDPELKAWWEAQQAFDRAVTSKLKQIPIPEDLRATILAGRKIEQFRPEHTLFSYWLAAAAVLAILCALGTSEFIENYGPVSRSQYTSAILPLIDHDSPTLAMTTPDHDKIIAWLKDHQAPMGTLPVKLADMPSLGCQKYMIHGHAVTLICFAISGGAEAHLFIVHEDAITDPPGSSGPEMWQIDGWSTASWSDGKMSYVLATQAGPDALKLLL